MRMRRATFAQRKRMFYSRLISECKEGRVDFDIQDFLRTINERIDFMYTTSSCSGRIVLASAPRLSFAKSRHLFKFVAKWHRPITLSELIRALDGVNSTAWLLVRPPILHFVVVNLDYALRLLKIAQRSGFKHSGIISVRDDGISIEVQGDDRLDVPIVRDGKMLLSRDELHSVVDLANETLMYGKLRLVNFIRELEIELLGRESLRSEFSYFKVSYTEFKRELDERALRRLEDLVAESM